MSTAIREIDASAPGCPTWWQERGLAGGYPQCWLIGDPSLMDQPLLGLLCSRRCQGDAIVQSYDLARGLRDAGVPVVGGFHSPMEKEFLELLLRGSQPVVICPARSLHNMRIPAVWRKGIEGGRVLVISPFGKSARRVTAALAVARNEVVAELAAEVFVPHAEAGGKLANLCQQLLAKGKPVWTFAGQENDLLISHGARIATAAADIFGNWPNQKQPFGQHTRENLNLGPSG